MVPYTILLVVTGPVKSSTISTPGTLTLEKLFCTLQSPSYLRYSFTPELSEAGEVLPKDTTSNNNDTPTMRGKKLDDSLNPLTAKLLNMNFHPLEVVSR